MLTVVALHVALLAVSGVTTGSLAVYAWGRRAEPGAREFTALMAVLTAYTVTHGVGMLITDRSLRIAIENVQWVATLSAPVCWLVFALAYTGYEELVTPRSVATLATFPVVGSLLIWSNGLHGLVWPVNEVVVTQGLSLMAQQFGPGFHAIEAYVFTLTGVGAVLLLRLVVLSDYLYADQSALLVVGIAALVLAGVLSTAAASPLPGPRLDLVPYAGGITGVTFGYALFRHRLFDIVPATRQLGRKAALSDFEDAVVILDAQRRVVYCNPAAGDLFDCEPRAVLGDHVDRLVDTDAVGFETEDALGELRLADSTYEVRTSPITDREGRDIGHTVIFSDITGRKEREERLRRQRDELEELDRINALIRDVNQALVGATTREEIAGAVCGRLVEADQYGAVWIGDRPADAPEELYTYHATDGGKPVDGGDTAVGDTSSDDEHPAILPTTTDSGVPAATEWTEGDPDGACHGTVVPLSFERTVYGALALTTDREDGFEDRELDVLDELGEIVGHAIDATASRRLLTADGVIELEFVAGRDPAFAPAAEWDCTVTLDGIVLAAADRLVVYQRIDGADPAVAADLLADEPGVTEVEVLERDDDEGVVECTVAGESLLVPLVKHGANVRFARADEGVRVAAEVAPDVDVRTVVDRVQSVQPDADLVAKRELDQPLDEHGVDGGLDPDLTDRQAQALEVAYRAGYFEWPREHNAEEVAERMDITSATFHNHLRKAERTLISAFFEASDGDRT
ncbi:histidine kinase N-terminal 7TM domain-containing protein [Halorientalis pallida]|uniref:histidine kinase N-terminal 7TM domain-containing protein n=1 Tax=Halorientalis pallida TaxID=2479928 RepID=UPI00187D5D10|nr:histidine kinase N-terminal 7TM domain-containing protein [Halorientalis pallida]